MDQNSIVSQLKSKCQETIEAVSSELRHIRTGKAHPSLVEHLEVNAYDGQMKMNLRDLASILTEGTSSIIISPFDVSIIKEIEKAIFASPLGLTPNSDGKSIRIVIPPLSEEQREKFLKIAGQKIEEGKVGLRHSRDNGRKQIKTLFDDKKIGEDDKFRIEKEIDKIVKDFSDKLDVIKEKKHQEIMKV
ncbi:ribosome recycling factor [Candidatus Roizmanbacteria bacterium RIFCSPHIGHO2_02_FULL_40_9]|uniref:Ribosome recycling factor n=2 Tax=Candidatus Roizmaniibacteriota TaxID=1752723 RepID=A0A1F7IMB7_9BACT|nr:MAG: ribosome recycling factor [Candidatus Roizmanbacteria bacterium RIFCSPHIGHO2_02_FULL_40_9]OGK44514.1 MAG: ribosome recycling factor [Candidatus Roizmanbacteria bacterium RIFCSPLOWO2_01_FULL_38_11]